MSDEFGGFEQIKAFFAQDDDFINEVKIILPEEIWTSLKAGLQATEDLATLKDRVETCKQQMLSLISTLFPVLSSFSKCFFDHRLFQ